MSAPVPASLAKIGDIAAAAGIRRVHMVAWRDLDDVEAGGSEVHAARICRLWAAAGVEVTMRTSFAQGHPPEIVRDGYRVVRRAGRYLVFPRAAWSELTDRYGRRDALVEIWNGMPFFSPLWDRGPRLVFVHHVHGDMWRMVLPPDLARVGDLVERRIAPRLYRGSRVVTLSESSKAELVGHLGLRPERVAVVPPGVDDLFTPGGTRDPEPLVLAVGRLVPVKHVDRLIRAVAAARARIPGLRLAVVGEGYERLSVEALVDELDAGEWVSFRGRVSPDELVDLYRRAWVLASASSHEGWGMSITEAAACATPAVVTDIAGHRDAVVDGHTGLLCRTNDHLADGLVRVVSDRVLRERLGSAALERSTAFRWPATAAKLMQLLADEARRR